MASAVDICNLSLAHLSDEATVSSINPPEGSAQAEHCARFYPIARDVALESHEWSFAVRREYLAEVTNTLTNWAYAYALPSRCLTPLAVLLPGATDDAKSEDYIIETTSNGAKVLYTNAAQAALRYTQLVTDTTKFSPLFVNAVSWLLASYLAGPVIKGKLGIAMKDSCYKMYLRELGVATVKDSNAQQTPTRKNHRPAWIANR